jgi:hypothetical protein
MATGKTTTLKEVGETLAFIVERMPTKDDLKNFATKDDVRKIVRATVQEKEPGIVGIELKPLRNDLEQIEARLDALQQRYANLKGVSKEIDKIRGEMRAIQKHLGLRRRSQPDHGSATSESASKCGRRRQPGCPSILMQQM